MPIQKVRVFAGTSSMKKAIAKQGFQNIPYRVEITEGPNGRTYKPIFSPELASDKPYIRSRGFATE